MQALRHSPGFLRRRRFLMVLPLLVLPFVIMLFFIFGGGKGAVSNGGVKTTGLNLQLPDAHFNKKREPDKLALYESVSQDSAKWKSAVKDDPYRKDTDNILSMSFEHSQALKDILDKTAEGFPGKGFEKLNTSVSGSKRDDHEKELTEKLSQLQAIVNAKPAAIDQTKPMITDHGKPFEKDLKQIKEAFTNSSADQDLVQLDKMLDKIAAIQHPEAAKDSTVNKVKETGRMNTFETTTGENGAEAIIPEKQTLVSGATIRIQLMDGVKINGLAIPAGQFMYGTAMLSNERLRIQVRSIRLGNEIIPVNLNVYDLDGMEGIYVPGSMNRDVSKQSLDQGLSGLGMTAIDPSIGVQAASAGIQAARTLISRKVKRIEVTIPNAYEILLKSEQ
jgi:conjugative transposon TraM protein